jgi:eukaryotic-like serine/threonine-protein kinase
VLEELQPGDPVQVGPYRLTGVLGTGGMGRVFLGWSPGGRPVAVKVIRPDLAAAPEFRSRFRREVTAARTVSGLYTALVIDADLDGPVPWLATAYVDGPSLKDAVAGYGPLPAKSLLALAAGLAEALAAVHAKGLVHRDLKPSNVLLASDGPRVIDFGISRAADTTTLTSTGQSIGSPGYLSPEQAVGGEVGPPSDIFSLGAVLAFAAIGDSPFGIGPLPALIYRVVHQAPALAGVPAEIRPLIERCLAKEPADRPTATDLLADLAEVQPGAQWLPERISAALAEFAVPALPPPGSGAAPAAPAYALTAASVPPPPGAPSPVTPPAGPPPASTPVAAPAFGAGGGRRSPLLRRSLLVPVASAVAAVAVVAAVLAVTLSGSGGSAAANGGTPTESVRPLAATHQPTTSAPATAAASTSGPLPSKPATPKPSSAAPKPTVTHTTVAVPCSFVVDGATNCGSTNPKVLLYVNFGNDTTGCTWERNISWGDGTSSNDVIVTGGPPGPKFAASHTFAAPGTYTIYFGGENTSGGCTIVTPTFVFVLQPS